MDFIKEKGYSCVTPMIVTNMDDIKGVTPHAGAAVPGETVDADSPGFFEFLIGNTAKKQRKD